MPMPSPSETVTTFLARWEEPGGLDQAFRDYFTDTTVWENVGWATTTGAEEAIALNHGYEEALGMAAIRVENLAVAESGNKVLTERIDHILDKDGNVLVAPKVMGIFEVEGGKIAAWRDYFDTRTYAPPA
jgi:limonene-1,2-epoxide hydrolase